MAKELPPRPSFPARRLNEGESVKSTPAAPPVLETPVVSPVPTPPLDFSGNNTLQSVELEEEYADENEFLGLNDSPFNLEDATPLSPELADPSPQRQLTPPAGLAASEFLQPETQESVSALSPQESVSESFSSPDINSASYNLLAPVKEEGSYITPELQDSIDKLLALITDEESSEVIINGPQEVMFKKNGARFHVPSINLGDVNTYHQILNDHVLCHSDTSKRITEDTYRIEAQLEINDKGDNHPPLLARINIVGPQVVRHSKVTIAKKSRVSFNLDDIANRGAMTVQMAEFLKICARGRITTVFSGLSGAGKTTMMEAFTKYFDPNDRVIVIEDTPELRVQMLDTVYLQTRSTNPGEDPSREISMEWLVRVTNRMRPDRILIGEIGGAEMGEFLIAANSGADGSMTTVHAGDPRRTLDKILGLAMKAGDAKNEMSIRRDIASTVQLIVQMTLIDGKHIVSHIEEVSNIMRQDSGMISTSTIYEFDRNIGYHVVRNRPSDNFIRFLNQRGLNLDINLFKR